MPIDNYASATSLSKQLEASVPFTVRPGKPLLKLMKEKGTPMSADRAYVVEKVMYSGDEGGILCMLQGATTDKTVVGSSLTHLIIDPAHPLAEAVSAYRQQRTQQLKMQEQRGFTALVGQSALVKKKKKRSGGFGS